MTLKRLLLGILTVLAFAWISLSLVESWTQPQIQSRLELYQTNLVLQGGEWQGEVNSETNLTTFRNNLIGQDVVKVALEQYNKVQDSAEKSLEKIKDKPGQSTSLVTLNQLINELDLRIGILQAKQGKIQEAFNSWENLIQEKSETDAEVATVKTARVLAGIWSNPVRLLPDAESIIRQNLDGWFRFQSLEKLYQLQERKQALVDLEAQEQAIAQEAIVKLAIVSAIPGIGLFIGILLLILLGIQLLLKRKDAILAQNADLPWSTPWDVETILQVFVVGFFLIGQVVIPLLLQSLHLKPALIDARSQALYILATYGLLMAGGLSVLYGSLKPFFPLPEGWFKFNLRGNWFLWGMGGYFVALPLVILVSLINQQLWDGQGGSNPILPIALENRDSVALVIFFITASIAAPVFEEIMFRGFLLPSLTRYLPLWGAIAMSGFLFAIAHLNISEVLPLMTLGIVLGFVYTRSRNLLAPMLLHSLWNSGTLLSLYILGSGAS